MNNVSEKEYCMESKQLARLDVQWKFANGYYLSVSMLQIYTFYILKYVLFFIVKYYQFRLFKKKLVYTLKKGIWQNSHLSLFSL